MNKIPYGSALRASLKDGFSVSGILADLQSGLVVAMIAMPLGMALAIASGVAPQYGLVTVIVGGSIAAVLGGSRFQVTGPTAAFVALLLPIVLKFGFSGLLVAGLISGALLFLYGVLGLGKAIEYVPHPVVTGFTSGIAVVIASIQIKDFFGLRFEHVAEGFFGRLHNIGLASASFRTTELAVGLATLILILVFSRVTKKVPGPVIALLLVSVATAAIAGFWPDLSFDTIGTRFSYMQDGRQFHGIPRSFPGFDWPWARADASGIIFELSWNNIRTIFPAAFSISLLAAVESLLSAVVADGMTGKRHDPDSELIGLGIANLVCPFFGGIPATGAIARTATNIKFGGTTPVAALSHAAISLLVLLVAAPLAAYLPMASLAALLLVVAWNMCEKEHFLRILKMGRQADRVAMLTCFILTVFIDMTVGITASMIIAAFMLIKRIGELGETKILEPAAAKKLGIILPANVRLYQVNGAMLFGAAHQAMEALKHSNTRFDNMVLDLGSVRTMDFSGLVALESTVSDLLHMKKRIAVVAKHPGVLALIQQSTLLVENKKIAVVKDIDQGLNFVLDMAGKTKGKRGPV